jgi:hypothetical protein
MRDDEMQDMPFSVSPLSTQALHEKAETEEVVLLPLVITQVDATSGCVSGLTQDGRWLRPEPVHLDEVTGENPYYAYGRPVHCRLGPSFSADRRPEDRELLERLPTPNEVSSSWHGAALEEWLSEHCDVDAFASFADERSVGLIRAVPQGLSLLQWTRGRYLVRLEFTDMSGHQHNWVVSDLPFCALAISILHCAEDRGALARRMVEHLQAMHFFLSLVLTKPVNQSRRDLIRGCQPLVGGVHTFPLYQTSLATLLNDK